MLRQRCGSFLLYYEHPYDRTDTLQSIVVDGEWGVGSGDEGSLPFQVAASDRVDISLRPKFLTDLRVYR